MNPRPFATPEVAFHFLASTATAVPDEPGSPREWRDPAPILAEARYRASRDPVLGVLYLASVAEMVANVIEEGDLWIASAGAATAMEARFRAIVNECGSAILADAAALTFAGIAARVEEALWAVNALAEADTFWEE